MRKKILKLFMVYSYITLLFYVGSETTLAVTEAMFRKGAGHKNKLKFEFLWKTALERYKKAWKIVCES